MAEGRERFECKKCGRCCNNAMDKESGKSYGLVFFPHESDFLKEKLKNMKKPDKIIPKLTFFDNKSEQGIVLLHELNDSKCPFQENNQCVIYDDRPSVCRTFPLIGVSVNGNLSIGQSNVCKNIDSLKDDGMYDREEIYKKILSYYPKEMLVEVFFADELRKSIFNMIDEMEKKGLIENAEEEKEWKLISLSKFQKEKYASVVLYCRKKAVDFVENLMVK